MCGEARACSISPLTFEMQGPTIGSSGAPRSGRPLNRNVGHLEVPPQVGGNWGGI